MSGKVGLALASAMLLWLSAGAARAQVPYTAVVATPAPGISLCANGLCQPQAVTRTRRAIQDRQREVRILMIGDSLTASGWIGEALQTRLQARARAIQVSSRGVSGADTRFLANQSDDEVRNMVLAERPDLIILAYGVNDGFRPDIARREFEQLLTGQVRRLRALAPGAEILIAGAPEGLGRDRGRACGPEGHGAPPALAMVRDVQRQVAMREGVAFWDWYGRMGGACSAERLAVDVSGWGVEPLMRRDRVHFSHRGAAWIGQMLADDLMGVGGAY